MDASSGVSGVALDDVETLGDGLVEGEIVGCDLCHEGFGLRVDVVERFLVEGDVDVVVRRHFGRRVLALRCSFAT